MKKSFAIAALTITAIALGTNNVQAQEKTIVIKSDPVAETKVNIDLADVISIESGADAMVSFKYAKASDYYSPQSHEVDNNLVITSSRKFDVTVQAKGDNFVWDGNNIPVDVLDIEAVSGGTMDGTFKKINLSTADLLLVEDANKGLKKSLKIKYSISADNASTLLGKPAGVYTQQVIYTATTK